MSPWKRCPRVLAAMTTLAWLAVIASGMREGYRFETGVGERGQSPSYWPAASRLGRTPGRPFVVAAIHPACPCSRASVSELSRALARCERAVDAVVLIYRPEGAAPPGFGDGRWARDAMAGLPGVRVLDDPGGAEAARFGAATSGHVLLYDGDGVLAFSGGVTAARGHVGGNSAGDALASLANGETFRPGSSPVFGCPILARGRADVGRTQ